VFIITDLATGHRLTVAPILSNSAATAACCSHAISSGYRGSTPSIIPKGTMVFIITDITGCRLTAAAVGPKKSTVYVCDIVITVP